MSQTAAKESYARPYEVAIEGKWAVARFGIAHPGEQMIGFRENVIKADIRIDCSAMQSRIAVQADRPAIGRELEFPIVRRGGR